MRRTPCLGLTLGFAIVTVVVIVVAVILSYASRISDQTQLANDGLEEVRAGTAALWEVRKTNAAGSRSSERRGRRVRARYPRP